MEQQDSKDLIDNEEVINEDVTNEDISTSKKKYNIRKMIFWILAITMMIVIFVFSSKNADDSTQESHRVGKFIGYMLESDFENWTEDAQNRYAEKYDHPIRKTAHFLEYMTLAILIFGAVYDSPYDLEEQSRRKKLDARNTLIPWCFATLYAISDEFHQTLVPGRSGQPSDIFIDGSGALLGVVLAFLITKAIGKYINS